MIDFLGGGLFCAGVAGAVGPVILNPTEPRFFCWPVGPEASIDPFGLLVGEFF